MQLGSRKLHDDLKDAETKIEELLLLLSDLQAPPGCQIILIPAYMPNSPDQVSMPARISMSPSSLSMCIPIGTIGECKIWQHCNLRFPVG